MKHLSKTDVSMRTMLMVGITIIGFLLITEIAFTQLKSSMTEQHKQKIKSVTEVAIATISHYHNLAAEGKMPEAEAKIAAKEALRVTRYGGSQVRF